MVLTYKQSKQVRRAIVPANKRLARRLPATRGYVKRTMARHLETKEAIRQNASIDLSYDNAHIQDLTTVTEGDDAKEKDGQRYRLQSLRVKGIIEGDTTTNGTSRIMIVQWYNDNSSDTPVLADFFNSTSTAINEPILLRKLRGNGKVLYDKRFYTSFTSGETRKDVLFSISLYGKRIPHKVVEDLDNATTGRNHLYLIAFSDKTDASTNEPALTYGSVVSFKDI